ncbi:GGDEF domain-containing protein [Thalassotalea sp. PLHSN55]|uniref:GGDEF domain-containing protein n=1 Tax=Thalassotalea sp. PLHSN55 TaxID=3435888 RepID=UPI003F82AF26
MQTLDIDNAQYADFNAFRLFANSSDHESKRRSELIEQLQITLEIDKLLNIFAMEATKTVDFSSLCFKNEIAFASIRGGKKAKHQHDFDLKVNNEFLGVLSYSAKKPINISDISRLNALHKCLLYPLRNALQYQRALSLAMQDGLTALGNRRYFDEQLKRAMHHAKRQHQQLGLIVCDLNKFKAINDNFGHKVGDDVLIQFSSALKASVRDSDSIFRFGGDEFSIIVEDACEKSLSAIEQRINIALKNNLTLRKYKVTCSLGHTFMNRSDSEKSLFERADKALYRAKMSMA